MLLTCLIWIGCVLRQKCKVVFTPSLLLMLLFLGWSLITLIWANDLSRAAVIFLMYMTRGILFLLLVPSLITTRQDLDKLMKLLLCIGLCVAISSLLFLLVYGYSLGTRLKVFEVNENQTGVALLIFLPGVLWLSSSPHLIAGLFGASKKSFKMAIGALYKKRLMTIGPAGIALVSARPPRKGRGPGPAARGGRAKP